MKLNFTSRCFALLTALHVSSTAAALEGFNDRLNELINFDAATTSRDLQGVECGGTIGTTYTPEEIAASFSNLFESFNGSGVEEAGTILNEIFPNLEFAVEVRKICASCQSEGLDNLGPYCGPSAYGYATRHSGNVFLPVTVNDDGSTSIINAKKLQTLATFRPLA